MQGTFFLGAGRAPAGHCEAYSYHLCDWYIWASDPRKCHVLALVRIPVIRTTFGKLVTPLYILKAKGVSMEKGPMRSLCERARLGGQALPSQHAVFWSSLVILHLYSIGELLIAQCPNSFLIFLWKGLLRISPLMKRCLNQA